MRAHAPHIIVTVLALDACWHVFHIGKIALAWITGEHR